MEQKYVDAIGICCENLEFYKFSRKHIKVLIIDDVVGQIEGYGAGNISCYSSAKNLVLSLDAAGNDNILFEDEEQIYERIRRYNDIASITLYYEDGKEQDIYVPYKDFKEDELGSPNIYQRSYINHKGDLYIVIDKEKKFEDFFPLKIIESDEKDAEHENE